jgi:DAK2 domain fusion protein YloV
VAQGTSPVGPVPNPADGRAVLLTTDHLVRWAQSTLLDAARLDIDVLNVFPVPDGDTGTNLALTWGAARDALQAALVDVAPGLDVTPDRSPDLGGVAPPDDLSLGPLLTAWARGALMGARGNSGVITAQMLRGVALTLGEGATADPRSVALALNHAVELAYGAVMHPVEGTMLTVAAAAARAATDAADADADLVGVVSAAVDAAGDALAQTPQQLDVLARAGVVDAGGQGLVLVLEALRAAVDPTAPGQDAVLGQWGLGRGPGSFVHAPRPTGGPGPDGAFEVMYLLDADDDVVPGLRSRLDHLGASVVVVGGDRLWNVHVHTDDAGPAVEAGVAVGHVSRIRITPLTTDAVGDDATSALVGDIGGGAAAAPSQGRRVRAVVAVAPGPRLAALFESVGARVVPGAARDRPTPAQLVAAAEGASEVLLLPNDDDHRGVAETAAAELRGRGATAAVLPTRAAVQGLAALAVHEPALTFTEDVVAMTAAAGATRHGAVSRAEREAITSAGICQQGDVLGLVEGDIAVIGADPAETACAVVDRMLSAGGELVTLICGDDPWPGHELADAVRRHLHRTRLDVELVVYDGGQTHYPLLVGVE